MLKIQYTDGNTNNPKRRIAPMGTDPLRTFHELQAICGDLLNVHLITESRVEPKLLVSTIGKIDLDGPSTCTDGTPCVQVLDVNSSRGQWVRATNETFRYGVVASRRYLRDFGAGCLSFLQDWSVFDHAFGEGILKHVVTGNEIESLPFKTPLILFQRCNSLVVATFAMKISQEGAHTEIFDYSDERRHYLLAETVQYGLVPTKPFCLEMIDASVAILK